MKESNKKSIFTFLLEFLKLIFSIGQKHVEKKIENTDHTTNN